MNGARRRGREGEGRGRDGRREQNSTIYICINLESPILKSDNKKYSLLLTKGLL